MLIIKIIFLLLLGCGIVAKAVSSELPYTNCRVETYPSKAKAINHGTMGGLEFSMVADVSLCSDTPTAPTHTFTMGGQTVTATGDHASLTISNFGTAIFHVSDQSDGTKAISTTLVWRNIPNYTVHLCQNNNLGTVQVCIVQSILPFLLFIFWVIPACACAAFLALAAIRKHVAENRVKAAIREEEVKAGFRSPSRNRVSNNDGEAEVARIRRERDNRKQQDLFNTIVVDARAEIEANEENARSLFTKSFADETRVLVHAANELARQREVRTRQACLAHESEETVARCSLEQEERLAELALSRDLLEEKKIVLDHSRNPFELQKAEQRAECALLQHLEQEGRGPLEEEQATAYAALMSIRAESRGALEKLLADRAFAAGEEARELLHNENQRENIQRRAIIEAEKTTYFDMIAEREKDFHNAEARTKRRIQEMAVAHAAARLEVERTEQHNRLTLDMEESGEREGISHSFSTAQKAQEQLRSAELKRIMMIQNERLRQEAAAVEEQSLGNPEVEDTSAIDKSEDARTETQPNTVHSLQHNREDFKSESTQGNETPVSEENRADEAAAAEEQRRADEAAAAEEQRRAAEAAAAEEQRRAAETAAAEEKRFFGHLKALEDMESDDRQVVDLLESEERMEVNKALTALAHILVKLQSEAAKAATASQKEARFVLEQQEQAARHSIEEDEVDAFSGMERVSKDNRRSATNQLRDRALRQREEVDALQREEDSSRHTVEGAEADEWSSYKWTADTEAKAIFLSQKNRGRQLELLHSEERGALEDEEFASRANLEDEEVSERGSARRTADAESKSRQQLLRDKVNAIAASLASIDVDEDEVRASIEEDELEAYTTIIRSGSQRREESLKRAASRKELIAAIDLESTARKILEDSEMNDRDTIDMNAATINYNPEYQERMLANEMPPEKARPLIGFSLTENIDDKTLIVDGIAEGGPAYQVGVRLGDEVVMLENRKVTTIAEVRKAVEDFCVVGKLTRMVLYRPGSGNFNVKLWMMTADPKYEGKTYYFDEKQHPKLVLPRKKKGGGMTPGGTSTSNSTAMSSPVARTPHK